MSLPGPMHGPRSSKILLLVIFVCALAAVAWWMSEDGGEAKDPETTGRRQPSGLRISAEGASCQARCESLALRCRREGRLQEECETSHHACLEGCPR